MGILAQHPTQIGIFSADKSRLWQDLPASGLPAESEQVWCNSCSRDSALWLWSCCELSSHHTQGRAPADTDGKCALEMELYLVKQITEKGQKGHQQLPPIQQASLLG